MNKLTIALVAALSLMTVGCKKKAGTDGAAKTESSGGSGEATGAVEPAGGAATGAKDCPAGTTKSEAGGFCIKLPDGFKMVEEKKMGSTQVTYRYRNADKNQEVSFTVNTFDQGRHDSAVQSKQQYSDEHKGQSGDIPNGKWWMYEEDSDVLTESITKNAKSSIECGTRIGTGDTLKAEVVDICKSLTAL